MLVFLRRKERVSSEAPSREAQLACPQFARAPRALVFIKGLLHLRPWCPLPRVIRSNPHAKQRRQSPQGRFELHSQEAQAEQDSL